MAKEKDICQQYNKETDTIENFHDIDIAKGTQQTTMAQDGCVQGWDADGKAIFIPRDSVLQILAEVINANNQSSITTLFGMNGSGAQATPASINMSNLASVLGAEGTLVHRTGRDGYEGWDSGGMSLEVNRNTGEITLRYHGYGTVKSRAW